MDQNNGQQETTIPNQSQLVSATTVTPPTQTILQQPTSPKPSSTNYFSRLFFGRINRRNFLVGYCMLILLLIMILFSLIIFDGVLSSKTSTFVPPKPGQSLNYYLSPSTVGNTWRVPTWVNFINILSDFLA